MAIKNKLSTDFPPNEALKFFKPFIGEWNTTGSHGMIPDIVLHGITAFDWHESGAFIIMRSWIYEDVGIPSGVTIIGSDNKLGTYTMIYYDERGVSRNMQASIEGNVLKTWRKEPKFSQRNTITISKNQKTLIGKGELSRDGLNWEKDLNLKYTKIKPGA